MKLAIVLPVFLCAFLSVSHAQINLNKAKNKASKTIKKKPSKTSSPTRETTSEPRSTTSGSSGGSNQTTSNTEAQSDSDKEKAAIRVSPAKDVLWDLRSALNAIDNSIGRKEFDQKIEKINTMIDQVEKKDPAFAYLKDYKDRASKAQTKNDCRKLRTRLESDYMWMHQNLADFENKLERFDRKKFDSLEQHYAFLQQNGSTSSYLEKQRDPVVAFYGNGAQNAAKILEHHKQTHGASAQWAQTQRSKPDFLSRKSSQRMLDGFEEGMRSLNFAIGVFEDAKAVFPASAELKAHYSKLVTLQKDLEHYKSSGALQADYQKVKELEIEQMRMSKPELSDASVDAFVKKELGNRAQEIQIKRVVIRTKWYVEKSVTGVPLYKGIEIEVAYSYKGKCYFNTGEVRREHLGGGKYSGFVLDDYLSSFTNYDKGVGIKCDNIFK